MNQSVQNTIYKYYNYLEERGYEVVGVFLFGSQNYGLDSEESDIDAKAMVVPTIEDIYNGTKPANEHIYLGDKSTIVVKDVRLYCEEFMRQGLSTLETLFTQYYCINPKYQDIWDYLRANRELICRYDIIRCIRAFVGTISNQYNFLKNSIEYEMSIRYKSLCSMQFHKQMLYRYIDGENFEDILKLEHIEDFRETKFNCKYGAQEVLNIAQSILEESIITKEDFIKYHPDCERNLEVEDILYNAIRMTIDKSILQK